MLLKIGIDRPIFAYYDQELFNNKQLSITKVGIGFDLTEQDTTDYGTDDFTVKKNLYLTQFCKITGGYKYYSNYKDQSTPFIDFCFFNSQSLVVISGGFTVGAFIDIFDKKTTWYTNNRINWINAGITLGYDFTSLNKDLIIAPLVSVGFGYSSFRLDTLTVTNLDEKYRMNMSNFGKFIIKLKTLYRSLSLDIGIDNGHGGDNNTDIYNGYGELTFRIWENKTLTDNYNKAIHCFFNALDLYLNYSHDRLEIPNKNADGTLNTAYSKDYDMFKFGIAVKLGKINFYN
jgi:hypothetical protein